MGLDGRGNICKYIAPGIVATLAQVRGGEQPFATLALAYSIFHNIIYVSSKKKKKEKGSSIVSSIINLIRRAKKHVEKAKQHHLKTIQVRPF